MDYSIARRRMVEKQIRAKGITDPLVLDAMLQVPRHLFVEEAFWDQAYGDFPLPIGEKQTISQPFTVAAMTEALQLSGGERVLEIGTGSGYQTAILAQIVSKLYSLERLPDLARKARRILDSIGCAQVHIRVSDGTCGWEEAAPFDAIIVTAGAPSVPSDYLSQLSIGGRLVVPVGGRDKQVLRRVSRLGEQDYVEEELQDCRFVPLIGRFGWREGA
ncbi:protein-L-isoaspartate(D-aspartate) O-methyltransferase [uncultured Desulfuromonas sp.]|uniref:protein-L-isoaspartate(D-aspartate) O-methyltransferase n=1 Tax=uncultured Desulfuromonas sp. TaxID=181013 RepID=UPI0026337AE1|nr:protein-L-isoaspartate(D-aspartate) O-methyltransferase [uncultured Desulfuromonas sp.]